VTQVVLFDIDGTLVLTGGAGVRGMVQAFEELFAVPDAFHTIETPGRTDSWILSAALTRHGIACDSSTHTRFHDRYVEILRSELHRPGPRKGVMPGIRELLDALQSRDEVYLALLTGNYEQAARLKLEYFDLWRYFACGAFGDSASDRNQLLPRALDKVRACGGPDVPPDNVTVIGDTPLDIACAVAGGARSIAVATGSYSAAQLRSAGADAVFEDLADLNAVMRELKLR
jgi:phosphoglycolate phosphatase-like HAD superfamily hydrolase